MANVTWYSNILAVYELRIFLNTVMFELMVPLRFYGDSPTSSVANKCTSLVYDKIKVHIAFDCCKGNVHSEVTALENTTPGRASERLNELLSFRTVLNEPLILYTLIACL